MDNWIEERTGKKFTEFRATQNLLTELHINQVRFVELRSQRPEYIFQGEFDLGMGVRKYSLVAHSGSFITEVLWLNKGVPEAVSNTEYVAGVQLALKLVESLPIEVSNELSVPIVWLIHVWGNQTIQYK
ncbi:MAG TPA: hypothetical protein VFI61_03610 [Patescibacteria group bacterium]|nr:hypothetical protein [Patescibacteria group bacterium]